ncbi:PREDICTED: 125 kDa kinesin-related protein-like [Populus euphratica]|uniref:Kinesin-like protein n=1 Tax=Populus euphratica TaxID=75702 RepID=A0AAJ6X3L0_POPEU|nr:PREDICTED: 125 kDa kinesin-related protein-like [Populus euphratica]
MSGRHDKEKGVNVQVLLRCRPFSEDELRSNAPQVVTCNDYQREVAVSQNIAGKHIDRVFTFDKVFGPSAQQRDLYEQAVVPIVHEVLEGFNCTIFAYGQTGTGKTYTMEGECKRSKSGPNGELPPEAGVIPRAVKQIFDTLESQNAEYSVKVTFLELYNEEITDLLAPEEISRVALEEKQKKQLPLMEDGKGGVLVRGLEEEIVTSASEIFTLLERGSAKRRTAETFLNKQSSRSHSLFSITIHIKEATPEGEELIKCGKLNLVDLAGSENISRSGAREIFDELQNTLSTHQGELALFAREMRQRFHVSCEQRKEVSEYMNGFLDKILEQCKNLENHAVQADAVQMKNIDDFQKAYEEQSKSDAEKLVADINHLVSSHLQHQKELVDARLADLRETATGNKAVLDGHVSSMEYVSTDAKRKWQEFSMQTENDAKDIADYSATKHCRMESLLQQCVSTAGSAFKHWEKTLDSVNEMGNDHVSKLVSLTRNASDSIEQHDAEVGSARVTAEQDVAKNTEDVLKHIDRVSEVEQGSVSNILEAVKAHSNTLETFREDHSGEAAAIDGRAKETFEQQYMDYEPTGATPSRSEPDVPSKGTIESLRAMPVENLLDEFRENNTYESFEVKELKPSLIPRSPLVQLNQQ